MVVANVIANAAILAGAAGKDGKKYARDALRAWQKLKESDFDMRSLSQPELRIVGELFPEVYDAQIAGPAALPEESYGAREAQLTALRQMQDVAAGGLPMADELAVRQIGRGMSQELQRGQLNALRALQERGLRGGEMAQAGYLGQQGADMAAQYGNQVAREALLRRLGAIQSAGSFAGGLRGQDIALSEARAGALNRWNEMVSGLRTQAAASAAGARTAARERNLGEAQRIADTNEAARYQAQLEDIERQNMLRSQLFQQQLARTAGISGQYGMLGQYQKARQAARAAAIRGIGSSVDQTAGGIIGGRI